MSLQSFDTSLLPNRLPEEAANDACQSKCLKEADDKTVQDWALILAASFGAGVVVWLIRSGM